ncbi:F-box protein [Nymphaea thermarum]|nr:F-box protein [Nymphaea thermarum]
MVDDLDQYKLCGFLCAVVSIDPQEVLPHPGDESCLAKLLPEGSRCSISSASPAFVAEFGLTLTPIAKADCGLRGSNGEAEGNSANCQKVAVQVPVRKGRRIGLLKGSTSVVHWLHTLVAQKCLRIDARVVRVAVSSGRARAVVLVDVYLPIALWSGWQFPRSGPLAAALFSHLSCNWEERKSWLKCDEGNGKYTCNGDDWMRSPPYCHVLGCKVHYTMSSSRKKLFELHEIFKSLSGLAKERCVHSSKISPAETTGSSGIWDISDDILVKLLSGLQPKDLVRVAASCRHLRYLAVSIMPCMKLKLFPHQQAAVEWMLQRERSAEVLAHPLYVGFSTEDGFHFYINTVSGEISTGVSPTITDFCGGMFCDEPGLGKTITALSLILKTQGTLADPPEGVEVKWCKHTSDQRCGYYELNADDCASGNLMWTWRRFMGQARQRGKLYSGGFSQESNTEGNMNLSSSSERSKTTHSTYVIGDDLSILKTGRSPCSTRHPLQAFACRQTRNLARLKRNLLESYEGNVVLTTRAMAKKNVTDQSSKLDCLATVCLENQIDSDATLFNDSKKLKVNVDHVETCETWVQCDACSKWRKLSGASAPDPKLEWFCNMNGDPLHQSCSSPEECCDQKTSITNLPGFYTKGTSSGKEQNVLFFTGVLKEHLALMNSLTRKALCWLSNLSPDKLLAMEATGLILPPNLNIGFDPKRENHGFSKIFQAFGLRRQILRGTVRWYYPNSLYNLEFDTMALQIALTKPLDVFRLYLSRATLIVVPANLVDHWKNQISKHVSSGQLRIYVWVDHKKPHAHDLAWDYDIVITTFNRLSAEWSHRNRSILMQIHWLRVMLDEGHTLGSSLCMTNKLQMAVSLAASKRWLLTGTPMPNTPNSQVAHLHPMLKFLHEEAYGKHQSSWEAGILRPFEAEMEEGRSRLIQLLQRCMISARKVDLQTIPPCIKRVVYLHFTEEHAKSYNELVVTVRRNILMADWNDPSHIESLLNPKQWKFRSNTIRNVRLSCCVAGHIKVTEAGEDIQETMDILVQHGLDPASEEYLFIRNALLNGGSCCRCKEWCRLPVITPCRHLLCLGCVALDSERCTYPGCGYAYEMQSPETLARPENPNPKWPVPKDLIELQPSYKQDNWDPDWHATSSSKVAYLVERLKCLQNANRKMGYSLAEDSTESGGKMHLSGSRKQLEEILYHEDRADMLNESSGSLPEKVIVFSQFLEHIHVIEQQLTIAGIRYAGMYSPMHSTNKMKSLMIFRYDPNCMVLLMDGSAALGLDLSFVTHVFLMEPIWDRSMEEQVISRAHRMGATRPVHVETLAMRGTIEEQMLGFLQTSAATMASNGDEVWRSMATSGGSWRQIGSLSRTCSSKGADVDWSKSP